MSSSFVNKCIVLWDIVDSSALSSKHGQIAAERIKTKCKSIIQSFLEHFFGENDSDTGDGSYIKFDSHAHAINFTTVVLQYFTYFKSKNADIPSLRFMLASAPVKEHSSGNMQGDALTLTNRLGKTTEPMCCTLDKSFYNDLMNINTKIKEFFVEFDINIDNVPAREAYKFAWQNYAQRYGDVTLKGIIYSHLTNAGVELSSGSINLLNPGVVFWPVVPRGVLTAIHRAQLEVLKVLDFIGWKVHIVIVNVCLKEAYTQHADYSDNFYKKIQAYMVSRDVDFKNNITKLSELFEIKGSKCCDARNLLEKNILRITFATLKHMNDKGYAKDDLKNIDTEPISRHLRPIYTITGLSIISDETNYNRNLILSGGDESVYWVNMTKDNPHNSIVIPRLDKNHNSQVMQADGYPIWGSKITFTEELNEPSNNKLSSNLPTWIRRMFISLPSFVLDDYGANAAKVDKEYKSKTIPVNILVDNAFPLLDLNK